MEKIYSLLIASDELFTCSAIYRYSHKHDFKLRLGRDEEIKIALPMHLKSVPLEDINLIYNPQMIDIFYAKILQTQQKFTTLRHIILRMRPYEIGSTHIGIATSTDAHDYAAESHAIPLGWEPMVA
ncbi:MAG: hypothetical protein RLZZ360_277 [Candidatus Parcubacteria bacterium]|jgi:hypothetical protein